MVLAAACSSKTEKVDLDAADENGFEQKTDGIDPAAETRVVEKDGKKLPMSRPRARLIPVHYNIFNYMSDESNGFGNEFTLSEISKEIAGKVTYELQEEGGASLDAKVAVVSAVPLADFRRDTELGRLVGEFLLTDLADRGLQVTELRIGREINILPLTGEFILSRNIGELAKSNPELDYVVVSTFSNTRKTLILQGRLVDLKNGLVKTSWRHTMPLNRELLSLFNRVDKPFSIAVRGLSK
ncbi:MAG: hypothetical protein KKB30_04680 [Proteobacteria bacterium]|nr:hypothetical protein [Pseudomonadota bacterium]MBU1715496.1 hypothetical protein [Pseudomonadota bacterium]